MKPLIAIPARYASTRLPGKPLIDICGKPMIVRVAERCLATDAPVVVVTDDARIEDACRAEGIGVVVVADDVPTGTDRVAAALPLFQDLYEFRHVVIVQGDEPCLSSESITAMFPNEDDGTYAACAMAPIKDERDIASPTVGKVVVDTSGNLLYISRSPIPCWYMKPGVYWAEVCIRCFRVAALMEFGSLPQSPLELAESIELLRLVENGIAVRMKELPNEERMSVDVPEDVPRARTRWACLNNKETSS